MSLAELIHELRALESEATPGPWQVHVEALAQSELGKEKGRGGGSVERSIHTAWDHPQLRGPAPVVTASVGPYQVPDRCIYISEGNAALIARMRNVLPALLDVAEAAATIDAAARGMGWTAETHEAFAKLGDALSRLKESR